jgi:hypothetical protein
MDDILLANAKTAEINRKYERAAEYYEQLEKQAETESQRNAFRFKKEQMRNCMVFLPE